MIRISAESSQAKESNVLVEGLQAYFVSKLNAISLEYGEGRSCETIEWGRDKGQHGGGLRYETRDELVFNRGSVNVSQVHYDDTPSKKLASATAISTIIHPRNPHAPSLHMHISWTQMRNGEGYWRIMADLNPSLIGESDLDKTIFSKALEEVAGDLYAEGKEEGDKYFNIPVLDRTRGVSHFYLEGYHSSDFEKDKLFAKKVGEQVIDTYIAIISAKLSMHQSITKEEKTEQLAYHTLYLFQVLTLDRGTTSGLLVHSQNDVGIMGSLPSHINRDILLSWKSRMPKPQDELVASLLNALPNLVPTPVEEKTKLALANAVRKHYTQYPKALSLQASAGNIPTTVENHI
ncbi:Coproporphyrinogen III oxidase, aerobic [hydrothermal vent metagenome]|uniref:coproporphyrinogen oxidase n=1 Tax=hydrothermal vent metagenome TaxID=652676 RepID=A0A1W1CYY2_9ZZZZ